MAYSEDNIRTQDLRIWVKTHLPPEYVYISAKEIHGDCLVFNSITGEIIAGGVSKGGDFKFRNKHVAADLTNWEKKKKRGFGIHDPGLLLSRIATAEEKIRQLQNEDKNQPNAKKYLKQWELELQELRGDI